MHKLLMEPKSGAADGTRRSSERQWRGRSRGWRELKVELFPSGGGVISLERGDLEFKGLRGRPHKQVLEQL